VVHFEHNVLSSVPAGAMGEVAEDLIAIFKVSHQRTAQALAEEFVELYYGKRFPKAVCALEAGVEDALSYQNYQRSHHARLRTTNMLERLFTLPAPGADIGDGQTRSAPPEEGKGAPRAQRV
jgi:transposase-like protein